MEKKFFFFLLLARRTLLRSAGSKEMKIPENRESAAVRTVDDIDKVKSVITSYHDLTFRGSRTRLRFCRSCVEFRIRTKFCPLLWESQTQSPVILRALVARTSRSNRRRPVSERVNDRPEAAFN